MDRLGIGQVGDGMSFIDLKKCEKDMRLLLYDLRGLSYDSDMSWGNTESEGVIRKDINRVIKALSKLLDEIDLYGTHGPEWRENDRRRIQKKYES